MAGEKEPMYYIYHMYDGKAVLDRADSWLHVKQHYAGDPKFEKDPVAATLEPMSEKTMAAYAKQYEIKFDLSSRPTLKAFVPPVTPEWNRRK